MCFGLDNGLMGNDGRVSCDKEKEHVSITDRVINLIKDILS